MNRSRSLFSIEVGLATSLPSIRPIRTPAMGPLKGMFEICRAAEAPSRAATSESCCPSTESTVAMSCVS